MDRRRFAFWIGMGLFGLSEKLNAASLDRLAEGVMRLTDAPAAPPEAPVAQAVTESLPVHWQATHNSTWRWVQREHFVDGGWKLTGMTTPIHRQTGEPLGDAVGYLDDSATPDAFRCLTAMGDSRQALAAEESGGPGGSPIETPSGDEGISTLEDAPGPDAAPHRKARHGRPPSRWLRSLTAAELSVWLASFEPPQADVSGMSFFDHLTRDHGFDETVVAQLDESDQARLHGAAHGGY